ncbi:MAG: TonB family protein [Woeseiaceae bacterium]
MPLDEFKTQVLLLHSEQSTLDSLCSGFGDSYTVHCATTGSEALNTLVDTPINVIVTAQNLPGMSGLEALREVKKRSPDMIGILLAEDEDAGLEALVSDKEVFQVVRGNVTGDSISKLVDNATQQMRLMALATSANDAAAVVEDESGEHIVMETSENGSTIISDGTGSVPVLDPTKISAASAVGSHSVDLLVLTKDNEFLGTIKQSSRGTHEVHYASTLAQADAIIRKNRIGVAVVDAAMVGEKIEQLTAHLRKGSPRLVSIVAGRREDGEMMMDLINRSKVYRFLLKPVSPGRARLAVEASVKHHLEAPDAAFKSKGPAAVAPAPPAAKPGPKPEPRSKPAPEARANVEQKAAAAKGPSKSSTAKASDDPPMGTPTMGDGSDLPSVESPNDDALSYAFSDDDESSFTETVTGLFATVSKKFSGDSKPETLIEAEPPRKIEPAIPDVPPAESLDDSSDGSLLNDPKLLGLGAAAIVVVAGALFWLMGGTDETPDPVAPAVETPAVTEATSGNETETSAADAITGTEEDVLLDEAAIDQTIIDAESALLESRIDDASAALELLGEADPGNERLPFLTAQLAQMQLRTYLIDARSAIRDARYEDAANALADARSLSLADTTEIDAAEVELIAAQDAQQSEDLLAQANARLEDGALLEPANDNARYFFEMALSRDPDSLAARQGLSAIASKLAMQARTETDNGNFDAAEGLLGDSNALDPDNSELAIAVAALADRRAAVAAELRQAEAEQREAEQREAEAREAEALAAAEREAEIERAAAAAAAVPTPVKESVALAPDQAAASIDENSPGDNATAGAGEPAGDQPAADEPETQVASLSPAAAVPPAGPTPTTMSALNRTRYVAPKYPRAAERRNLSGWVDVIFTVDTLGLVKDISIRDSQPGETFISAATRAVEKWEFEPVIENGQSVEKRVGVRMMFTLE